MGNVSYCRFSNAAENLAECFESRDDEDLSAAEAMARVRLIRECVELARDYGWEIGAMLNDHELTAIYIDEDAYQAARERAKAGMAPGQ